jgi:uncharacterized protein DUF2019
MIRDKLERIAVPLLIERFTAIGVDQDKALLGGEHGKFNRLFDEMVKIEEELKMRDGDQRRELLDLYDHPNAQVRLNAVKATLVVAPEQSLNMLKTIAKSREYPQAGDAGMTLISLERGIFKPT